MTVLKPLSLVIESFPDNEVEELDAPYWPTGTEPSEHVPASLRGSRKLPFSRDLLIDRDDFAEVPPAGWKRLAPGRQVRLRHGYILTCTRVEKDNGEITRVICTHDPATRGGISPDGKRVDGTIQWVSAAHAKDVEVRLYDRLFTTESPGEDGREWLDDLNPAALSVVRAKGEPVLAQANPGDRFQFERVGFFYADPDTSPGAPVFNRTVPLKDGWAKQTARALQAETGKPVKGQDARPKHAPAPKGDGEPKPAASAPAPLTAEAQSLVDGHGLTADEARVLTHAPLLRTLFDAAVATPEGKKHASAIASVLVNDLLGETRQRKLEELPFGGAAIVELVLLGEEGTISTNQAKEVLSAMIATGQPARAIVEAKGMKQIASADALGPIVDAVLASNAEVVARYKGGNANVFGAIVGMVMKQTKGQGNPKLVAELVKQKLA